MTNETPRDGKARRETGLTAAGFPADRWRRWPEARSARLVALALSSHSAASAARLMGISRNAAIGHLRYLRAKRQTDARFGGGRP